MTARDDGESIDLFEPLIVSKGASSRSKLNDLALTLAEISAAFSSSLPPAIAASLADLVTIVDCYHTNAIEGHHVHPIDIARAIHDNYSDDRKTHVLQLEARAHISVQEWIDDGGIAGAPFSTEVLCEIHRRFYALLPAELLLVETGNGDERVAVEPGAIRTRDVKVGRHVAISPGSVPRFLLGMEQRYASAGRIDRILIAAFGHHRLLWVHPFLDGNGRVARLASQAALRSAIRTRGLWSLARGLALREREYLMHLRSCDVLRQDSLDGRGTLSEGALADFGEYFLETCIDQVDFMSGVMQPHRLRDRVLTWAHEGMRAGTLPPSADAVLTAILYRGELERGDITTLIRASDRSARRLTAALIRSGAVQSETSRAPLRLAFPVALAMRWLPGLFLAD